MANTPTSQDSSLSCANPKNVLSNLVRAEAKTLEDFASIPSRGGNNVQLEILKQVEHAENRGAGWQKSPNVVHLG